MDKCAELGPPFIGYGTSENWPHSLPAAAPGKGVPAPCLGSTVERAQVTGVQLSRQESMNMGELVLPFICYAVV